MSKDFKNRAYLWRYGAWFFDGHQKWTTSPNGCYDQAERMAEELSRQGKHAAVIGHRKTEAGWVEDLHCIVALGDRRILITGGHCANWRELYTPEAILQRRTPAPTTKDTE